MRDFMNSGDMKVNGNLIINDHSQNDVGKLLINCTSDELIQERPFRQENLQLERKRKTKKAFPFLSFAVIIFIIASVWGKICGDPDLISFSLGIASLLIGIASIKYVVEPNAFEIREKFAVREINLILKSRRVE